MLSDRNVMSADLTLSVITSSSIFCSVLNVPRERDTKNMSKRVFHTKELSRAAFICDFSPL